MVYSSRGVLKSRYLDILNAFEKSLRLTPLRRSLEIDSFLLAAHSRPTGVTILASSTAKARDSEGCKQKQHSSSLYTAHPTRTTI